MNRYMKNAILFLILSFALYAGTIGFSHAAAKVNSIHTGQYAYQNIKPLGTWLSSPEEVCDYPYGPGYWYYKKRENLDLNVCAGTKGCFLGDCYSITNNDWKTAVVEKMVCPPGATKDFYGYCYIYSEPRKLYRKKVSEEGGVGGEACQVDGNPVYRVTGLKRQRETDIALGPVRFERVYASYSWSQDDISIGVYWSANLLSKKIVVTKSDAEQSAEAIRGDSTLLNFKLNSGTWTSDADVMDRLIEVTDESGERAGWKYYDAYDEAIEEYDSEGLLTSITTKEGKVTTINRSVAEQVVVTDYHGKNLTFTYDANGRIIKLSDPLGNEYHYSYATNNNLLGVLYPDGKTRQYHYEHGTYTNALTGITDENGIRFATYTYDTNGKAIETKHVANGVDVYKYSFVFSNDYSQTTVTDPLGTSRTYNYEIKNNTPLLISQSQPGGSGCGAASSALTYDANGNVTTRTDWNGNVTTYAYDLTRNLETQRVEASGKAEAKTTSTQWHSYWRLPVKVAEPKKVTTYVYNGDDGEYCAPTDAAVPSISGGTQPIGVLCSKTEQATTDANGSQGINPTVSGTPRVWQYTYNTYGRVLTATDPNNHTTTNTYYAIDDASVGNRGNLHTSTNAAGHTTTYSNYDANGRVGSITDANGLTTNLTYSPRGWLTSKVVTGGGSTETTTYTYDGVGQMTKVSLPDGAEITYTYDDAHRLTQISDKLGNSIHYTLDAMGNRTKEEVKDPSGNLARQVTRVYDALNRLEAITGGVQ